MFAAQCLNGAGPAILDDKRHFFAVIGGSAGSTVKGLLQQEE